jgi:small-conductance mechanosensitive channel
LDPAGLAQIVRSGLDGTLFTMGGQPFSAWALIELGLVLAIAVWLGGSVQRLLLSLCRQHGSFNRGSVLTVARLMRWLILAIGIMAGLGLVGVPLSHLAIIFSALTVGIGFGLQTMVSNLVSGLILLGEGSIRVGDFIVLPSGEQGTVDDISMRSTRIRTPDGTLVLVPNSTLVEGSVRNLSALDAAHRQRFDFSVGYGTSKSAVHDAVAAAARAIPSTLEDADHPIEVALQGLGAVTLDYQLVVWVRNSTLMEPYRTRSAYLAAIDDTITRSGFAQPNPAYDVNLRSAVPPPTSTSAPPAQ